MAYLVETPEPVRPAPVPLAELRQCGSEDELHRHLHNPRIGCTQDAAEVGIRERRTGIARIHVVRRIERFGTELNGLV